MDARCCVFLHLGACADNDQKPGFTFDRLVIPKLLWRSCGLINKRALPDVSCDFPVFYWLSWFSAAFHRLCLRLLRRLLGQFFLRLSLAGRCRALLRRARMPLQRIQPTPLCSTNTALLIWRRQPIPVTMAAR